MARWLILLAALVIWVVCMSAVYTAYRPREHQQSIPGTEAALSALFDEQAQPVNAWRIYVDPVRLKKALPGSYEDNKSEPHPADETKLGAPWDGVDEKNLLHVGQVVLTLKKKVETRLEQVTDIKVTMPHGINPLLDNSSVIYKSWKEVGIERGLETFNSSFTLGALGQSFEASSMGSRDGDAFNVTWIVFQNSKRIMQQQVVMPVKGKALPNLNLMPFEEIPQGVKDGFTFDIVMMDLSLSMSGSGEPKFVTMKATCKGPVSIQHGGNIVKAFEARSEDGKARAWYSSDGIVLKQDYLIAGALEVMLVKIEPRELSRR